MPDFTKGTWKYLPAIYQVVSYPEGAQFPILKGMHVFPEDNSLWHSITGELTLGLDAPHEEECHANGRLIANAPDMYVALKKCVEFINHIAEYSLALDVEDLREYIENILKRIDGTDTDKEEN